MQISNRKIKIHMAINGMIITTLAAKIGMAPQNLSTVLVRGTCRPETAMRIATALGVTIKDIIGNYEKED